MQRETVVVVGHGMVGHRFCEQLVERGGLERFEVVVLAEEPRPAYDRVGLSRFFSGETAEDLALTTADWYAEQDIELALGEAVTTIDPATKRLETKAGRTLDYDHLVLATGSVPFVPPIPGNDLPGVFVYRTIEDLEAIAAWADRPETTRATVIGGGLLGLEAAKAATDLGLETSVLEFADRLMPRQVDASGGALLERAIESLGVHVYTSSGAQSIVGDGSVGGLELPGDRLVQSDMVIISAGIKARDDLARAAGLEVGERGGVLVDDSLTTSVEGIYAIGECAVHSGTVYGLVAPGYEMAEVLARRLLGEVEVDFKGADLSTKLKLLGVDVASFGDAFADEGGVAARKVVIEDAVAGVYQKLVISADGERLARRDPGRRRDAVHVAAERDPARNAGAPAAPSAAHRRAGREFLRRGSARRRRADLLVQQRRQGGDRRGDPRRRSGHARRPEAVHEGGHGLRAAACRS